MSSNLRFCTQCGEKRKTPTIKFCVACGWKYPEDGGGGGQSYGTDEPDEAVPEVRMRGRSTNICTICNKTLYSVDKVSIDDVGYHIVCFKCVVCKKKLDGGTFRKSNSGFKCVKHFKEEVAGLADLAEKKQKELDDSRIEQAKNKPSAADLAGLDIGPTVVGEVKPRRKRTAFKPKKKIRRKEYDVSKQVEKAKQAAAKEDQMYNQTCGICDKKALPRVSLVYEDVTYHHDCFKCVECNRRITIATVNKMDGKFFCDKDYKLKIQGDVDVQQDAPKKTGEKYKPDPSKMHREKGDVRVASPTHSHDVSNRCGICKKKSYPKESVMYDGTIFHATCLRCTSCETKLVSATCNVHDDQYYCEKHYLEVSTA